jgi:agmatine deiminase
VGFGREDPNTDVFADTARRLSKMTDARGDALQVVRIPSPGRVELDGDLAPASHMNFVIAERAVILPIYNDLPGQYALEALKSAFPEREVIGLPSRHLLTGGGSFHCITQQEPA